MNLEMFTEDAKTATRRSTQIAENYGHLVIETEHLLLALFEQTTGMVQQVLIKLDVDRYALVQGIAHLAETYPKAAATARKQTFLAPRLRNLLSVAHQEAQRLGDALISTEHLFLAMFADRENPLVGFLQDSGLSRDKVYQAIEEIRKADSPPE